MFYCRCSRSSVNSELNVIAMVHSGVGVDGPSNIEYFLLLGVTDVHRGARVLFGVGTGLIETMSPYAVRRGVFLSIVQSLG